MQKQKKYKKTSVYEYFAKVKYLNTDGTETKWYKYPISTKSRIDTFISLKAKKNAKAIIVYDKNETEVKRIINPNPNTMQQTAQQKEQGTKVFTCHTIQESGACQVAHQYERKGLSIKQLLLDTATRFVRLQLDRQNPKKIGNKELKLYYLKTDGSTNKVLLFTFKLDNAGIIYIDYVNASNPLVAECVSALPYAFADSGIDINKFVDNLATTIMGKDLQTTINKIGTLYQNLQKINEQEFLQLKKTAYKESELENLQNERNLLYLANLLKKISIL